MITENKSVATRDNFIDDVKNSEVLSVSRKGTLVEAIGTESDPSKILGPLFHDDDDECECTTCETECGEQFI